MCRIEGIVPQQTSSWGTKLQLSISFSGDVVVALATGYLSGESCHVFYRAGHRGLGWHLLHSWYRQLFLAIYRCLSFVSLATSTFSVVGISWDA